MENPAFNEDLRQLKACVRLLQSSVLGFSKSLRTVSHEAHQAHALAKALRSKYEKEKKARDKYILKLRGKIKTLTSNGSHS